VRGTSSRGTVVIRLMVLWLAKQPMTTRDPHSPDASPLMRASSQISSRRARSPVDHFSPASIYCANTWIVARWPSLHPRPVQTPTHSYRPVHLHTRMPHLIGILLSESDMRTSFSTARASPLTRRPQWRRGSARARGSPSTTRDPKGAEACGKTRTKKWGMMSSRSSVSP